MNNHKYVKVHYAGKYGDLTYCLPVLRALCRTSGKKIHLIMSGAAWQFVPLLEEQPYFGMIELDDTRAYEMKDNVMVNWDFFKDGEGLNLSIQPCDFDHDAPVSWTCAYMRKANIGALTNGDCVALPTLVNHRRYLYSVEVFSAGIKQTPPNTIIVAPETETLDELFPHYWQLIIDQIHEAGYQVLVVGMRTMPIYHQCTNLRGATSVPVLARLIAESRGFIGAHSFPWHLARHSETPAVCLQTWRDGLARCIPVDTPYTWIDAKDWRTAVETLLKQEPVYAAG